MPAWRAHAGTLFVYALLALALTWPLPRHVSTHLTGAIEGDTGVYVWNQWVFRHELVDERSLPYFTGTIFSLAPKANLSLHNYTTFANVLALPMLGTFGVVTTFNIVYLLLMIASAYAMFLLARRVTGGAVGESLLAGILFAWSPVLVARGAGTSAWSRRHPCPSSCSPCFAPSRAGEPGTRRSSAVSWRGPRRATCTTPCSACS
jgi:hypothetical protein